MFRIFSNFCFIWWFQKGMAKGELLPNQYDEKIGDVDQSEAYFIYCRNQGISPEKITSQEAWQRIGSKSRAQYRLEAGFQGVYCSWFVREKRKNIGCQS